ncbi:TPA: hypothetical protein ACXOGX_000046 [Stenotrophomonas maltophilia]
MTEEHRSKIDPRALQMQMADDDDDLLNDKSSQELDRAVDKTIETAHKMKDGAKKVGAGIWSGLKSGVSAGTKKKENRSPAPVKSVADVQAQPVVSNPEPAVAVSDQQPVVPEHVVQEVEQGPVVGDEVKPKVTPTPVAATPHAQDIEPADRAQVASRPKRKLIVIAVVACIVAAGSFAAYFHFNGSSEAPSAAVAPVKKDLPVIKEFKTPRGAVLGERVTAIFGKSWSDGETTFEISRKGVVTLTSRTVDVREEYTLEPSADYTPTQINPKILIVTPDGYIKTTVHYKSATEKSPHSISITPRENVLVVLRDKELFDAEQAQALEKEKAAQAEAEAQKRAKEQLPLDADHQGELKPVASNSPLAQLKPAPEPATQPKTEPEQKTVSVKQPSKESVAPKATAIAPKPVEKRKAKNDDAKVKDKKDDWQDKANSDLDAWAKKL